MRFAMYNRRSYFLSGRFILGVAAILFGVILLLDNLDFVDAHQYLRFWPVVLIALGAARLAYPCTGRSSWFVGGTLILVGTIMLLHTLGVGEIGFSDIWPLILVLIGGSLILGSAGRTKASPRMGSPVQDAAKDAHSSVNGVAILGGFQRSENSQEFQGGDLMAIMGGCEIDLRQAAIAADEASIDTFAMWGGIKIKVPQTWNVILHGFPFLGGFDDKTVKPSDPSAKRLVIRGTAIMGGVEITN